jgi:archaetidylinositol phosphate synthase
MNAESATTKNEATFRTARRVNQALTASIEKRALQWMAERAPNWLTSDQLTLLGFIAQVGAGLFYAVSRFNRYALLAVILCLALNWFGDSMDGTLARVRRQQRPRYGFYVDHMVDHLRIGRADERTRMLRISTLADGDRDAGSVSAAFASESYLATYTLTCFQMSQGIFGPTEIRILLIIGNLELLRTPYSTLFGHRILLFDLGGIIAADQHVRYGGHSSPCAIRPNSTARSRCREPSGPLVQVQPGRRHGHGPSACRARPLQQALVRATTFLLRLPPSNWRCCTTSSWHHALHMARPSRRLRIARPTSSGFIFRMAWSPCWGISRSCESWSTMRTSPCSSQTVSRFSSARSSTFVWETAGPSQKMDRR